MNSKNLGALRLATRNSALLMAAWIVSLGWFAPSVSGEALVGDVFVTGFDGWTDTCVPYVSGDPPVSQAPPNWGVLLTEEKALSECNNVVVGPATSTWPLGEYDTQNMVNMNYTTPSNYTITANLGTWDDDGYGIVFGYQDEDNYFRVGFRQQDADSYGFPRGMSLQKVVGGTITNLGQNTDIRTILPYDGSFFDCSVTVTGNSYSVKANPGGGAMVEYLSGTDDDLPTMAAGHYGVHSWAQKIYNDKERGTLVNSVTVSSSTLNKTHTFSDVLPVNWRFMVMTNNAGGTLAPGEDFGNFRQDFRNGTIVDDTNGYVDATASAPHIDFIGPAVVIDEPGNESWGNYRMKVRMESGDNDGMGLLVRVQDDVNFYRINFSRESIGTGNWRAPQGMSIQKCDYGTWYELFRDDQANPNFVYTEDQPFDVTVNVVNNAIQVQIIDDPDGAATEYTYLPVIDTNFPILAGSVGFTNWGCGDNTNGVYYSAYGGDGEVLLETVEQIVNVQATLDRTTGNITLKNLGADPVAISRYSILSVAGGLNPAGWTPITDRLDEPPPGNGSFDPDDPWAVDVNTNNELTESEIPGGNENGGTLGLSPGGDLDLGNCWIKSVIEDVAIQLELPDGTIMNLPPMNYTEIPYDRSDLNTDGTITAADWLLFYPNTLADMSSMSRVEQVLAGDLDNDGDNDVRDYNLFKADFEAANGAGSFEAMLASIPEPSSLILLLLGFLGAIGFQRWARSIGRRAALLAGFLAMVLLPGMASAVDFTTFTVDNYPPITGKWVLAEWTATPTTATHTTDCAPNVFYSTENILNSRILGTMVAGTDDDIVGMVFGYNPGDTSNTAADFLLLDWKGVTQSFDFDDLAGYGPFHDLTGSTNCPAGMAMSRVTGIPTADELWGHVDLAENPDGGVEELARAATLGSSRYPGNNPVYFDIRYTSTAITVYVNDVEEFNISGTFGSGRLGLYTHSQGPPAIYSNFDIIPLDQVLSATVDTTTGEIVLTNKSTIDLQFDFYQFDSAGNSLNPAGWSSLDSKNYDATGSDPGQSWDEAGGSSASAIAEMYLQGSTILSGSESVSLGNAYDTSINAKDLELTFRVMPYGYIINGTIEYIESPTQGGDFDEDGDVDGNDFLAWQRGFGMTTGATHGDGDANNDGKVTSADLDIWKSQFGSGGAGAGAGVNAIPEPGAFWLIALVLAGLFCQRMG